MKNIFRRLAGWVCKTVGGVGVCAGPFLALFFPEEPGPVALLVIFSVCVFLIGFYFVPDEKVKK